MLEKRGFTLIELLIVVAIIAILAAIAVPNFLEAQVRAKVSRGKSDMRSVVTALEAHEEVLAQCAEDLCVRMWDLRSDLAAGPVQQPQRPRSYSCRPCHLS